MISSSPGELEPVFNKILENATRICNAEFGTMVLQENGGFRFVALYNIPPAYVEFIGRDPVIHSPPDGNLQRVARTSGPTCSPMSFPIFPFVIVHHCAEVGHPRAPVVRRGRFAPLAAVA